MNEEPVNLPEPSLSASAEAREERMADREDVVNARVEEPDIREKKPFWKSLGPGLITGAADNDPAGIGTYSVVGAQFGYKLLWPTLLCLPLMIAVQEMCGRVALLTGKGLAAVVKEHYSKWLLLGCVFLLMATNIINIYADLNIMASSAKMLFHGPFIVWISLISLFIMLTQIFMPYAHYARFLKWLCLTFIAYAITALMPSVHNAWGLIFKNLVLPTWQWKTDYLMALVGSLGTTISPYLFFWQAGQQVEELIAQHEADAPGKRKRSPNEAEMHNLRADTASGMSVSQLVTFFIIICTAATLHAKGITNINTAQDAAKALAPLGGKVAYWLFALGILGAGLLAVPTLAGSAAYALSESLSWRHGLYRRFQRARAFYLTIAGMVLVGYLLNFFQKISPIKALFYASVLNGVVAVPLLVVLLFICNNAKVMKARTNRPLSNLLGGLAVLLLGAASLFMLWALATGHSS
jgi:NRAMP (natural resistance-associated macrophage protein)-like metal ion transporter